MSFLAGIGAFIVVLIFGGGFSWALMLGLAAGAFVYFVRTSSSAPDSWLDTRTVAQRDAAEENRPVTFEELVARVSALEKQVAALLNTQPAEPPAPSPVPLTPASEISRQVFEPKPEPPRPEVPPQPAAPVVSEPEPPSFFARLISGNIVAKVGAIVLFFGVGFLLKFAYDRGVLPPQARLAGVAVTALIVFVIGWRLRESRRLYGLILQGVASGLAYLTVFFALKTYGFIAVPTGFGLFALLGVATTLLAVREDAKPLALLGLTGAFLAPILASTGQGNHVMLFSYYLLLNAFILAVSWFKAWRTLNLTGWFFTFAVAALWGWRSYTPALFGTAEPFLLAFFAMYLVIPILFATRQPPELKGLVDGTLVFGTPAAAAVMQAHLVWDLPYGLAWSAALGAALYGLLAVMVLRHQNMRLLGATYISLAVGLGTLAIAFAFGAYTTFALWTIEGTAILWVCLRQKQLLGRMFAILVQGAGAVQFFLDYERYARVNPWFNDAVVGCAIIALASVLSAVLYRRHGDKIAEGEKTLGGLILAWGALCYSIGALDAIHHGLVFPADKLATSILFFSGSTVVAELAGARNKWVALRGLTVVHPLILAGGALYQLAQLTHPLADLGWIAWPLGLGSLFWILHRQRRDGFQPGLRLRYGGGWVLLAALTTWEAAWWLREREYLTCMSIALIGYVAAAMRYRLREHGTGRSSYLSTSALLWAMLFWFGAGLAWIHHRLPSDEEVRAALFFAAATSLLYGFAASVLEWPAMRMAARLPWVAIPLALLAEFEVRGLAHPFSNWLGLAWPASWLLALYTLRREENDAEEHGLTGAQHCIALYAPIVIATWELMWWVGECKLGVAWQRSLVAVPASLALIGVVAARNSAHWPLDRHWSLYRTLLTPVALGLMLWSLVLNFTAPGSQQPLSVYIPVLNPLDLAIALAALAVTQWVRCIETQKTRSNSWRTLAVLGFVWGNAIALRSIHYWADVPYRMQDLMESVLVQATLSILWTSAALALMLISRLRMERALWVTGASLLAVVVGKLFLVDLANSATVARIVSFLGVGVILLVIGYVAPVPPGIKEAEKA